MPVPRSFRSFAEFERECIRPHNKIGLTVEEMVEDNVFETQNPEFDNDDDDPFAEMRRAEGDY